MDIKKYMGGVFKTISEENAYLRQKLKENKPEIYKKTRYCEICGRILLTNDETEKMCLECFLMRHDQKRDKKEYVFII